MQADAYLALSRPLESYVGITSLASVLVTFQAAAYLYSLTSTEFYCLVGPIVFRGKFCQIPRRRLPNSAAHRGKFLEFRGLPRPPIIDYTVPTLAQLYT